MPAFSREASNTRLVHARAQAVYRAIQHARTASGCRKLVSYKNHRAIIEEDFTGLPILGTAHCTYQEVETSASRIDYALISSDKLTKFEGAWVLTPVDNGKQTLVELISTTEANLKLPFADRLTLQSTNRHIAQRLHEIAASAEAEAADVAALPVQPPEVAKK